MKGRGGPFRQSGWHRVWTKVVPRKRRPEQHASTSFAQCFREGTGDQQAPARRGSPVAPPPLYTGEMEQIALDWGPQRRSFTVSELTERVREIFLEEFTDIWVTGEISGVKLASSGHYYFTLKDDLAQLRCACYKMTARYLKFKPVDGVAVLAESRRNPIRNFAITGRVREEYFFWAPRLASQAVAGVRSNPCFT